MKKLVEIDTCYDCPNYHENDYITSIQCWCCEINEELPEPCLRTIPEKCPLPEPFIVKPDQDIVELANLLIDGVEIEQEDPYTIEIISWYIECRDFPIFDSKIYLNYDGFSEFCDIQIKSKSDLFNLLPSQ